MCKGLDKYQLGFEELRQIYSSHGAVYLDSAPRGSFDTPVAHLSSFAVQSFNAWSGKTEDLKEDIAPLLKNGYTVCVMAGTARSAKALAYDLNDDGINAVFSNGYPLEFQKGAVTVTTGTITAGFVLPVAKFALITHMKAQMQKAKKHKANAKMPFIRLMN